MAKDKWNIKIRRATLDDLSAMQELYVETIRSTCKKDYDQAQIDVWTASVENEARWKEAVTQQYFLVATTHPTIVGFGSLKNGDFIDFMYVHKDYVRQGIAERLYQELENEAKRLGHAQIAADVSKTARPFFEKKGFQVVRENKRHIKGVEITNYRMVKS